MKSGGTWIACSSVLNAVRRSQPSGKKMTSVTSQAAAVRTASPTGNVRAWAWAEAAMASVQVLADEADEEHRGDVGQHHREQRARRRHAGVEVQQRLLEDEEGHVGA